MLLGTLGLFVAAPAAAAVLVSNIGERTSSSYGTLINTIHAQRFTTGSHALGYDLTSIEFQIRDRILSPSRIKVEVWGVAANGRPDSTNVVARLNVPSDIPQGNVAFTAPEGTTLQASTSYFVVLGPISGASGSAGRISNTASDNEQKAAGWSMANDSYFRNRSPGQAWQSWNQSRKIRVNGTNVSTKTYALSSATTIEGVGARLTVTLGENAPAGGG